ncbi:MAG: tetratricopeptide repeat protein [Candidatus Obscuribacterales bacterium]
MTKTNKSLPQERQKCATGRQIIATASLLFALLGSFSLAISSADAAAGPQYKLGVKAYQARRYSEAATYFHNSIAKEGGSADAWLYLGHSFYAAGDTARAEQTYKTLQANINKYSPQSITAGRSLRMMHLVNATKLEHVALGISRATNLASAKASTQGGQSGGQITVQTPKIGHPEVSSTAVNTIRAAFDGLPPSVKQLLIAGNVQIVVTPTMIDKFPAGAYQERMGYNGGTDKSCDGLCTGRTVVIAEHKINERTDEVGPAISPGIMQETFLHETGHAVDNCINGYAQSAEFKAAYSSDIAKMSDDDKARLSYFLQKNGQGQVETFAELTSYLLGNHRWAAGEMVQNCPASFKCVKEKLGL